MRLIAKRRGVRFLAAAKLVCAIAFDCELMRQKSTALMAGFVAKRLVLALSATAIEIGCVGFEFDDIGFLPGHIRFIHIVHFLYPIIT